MDRFASYSDTSPPLKRSIILRVSILRFYLAIVFRKSSTNIARLFFAGVLFFFFGRATVQSTTVVFRSKTNTRSSMNENTPLVEECGRSITDVSV